MDERRAAASPWTYVLLVVAILSALFAAGGAWQLGLAVAIGAGVVVAAIGAVGVLVFARGARIPGVLITLAGAGAATCCAVSGAAVTSFQALMPDSADLETITLADRRFRRHPTLGFLVGDPGERFVRAPQIAVPMSVAMNGIGRPLGGWGWADPRSGASMFAAAARPTHEPNRARAAAFLQGFVAGGMTSPTLDAPFERWGDDRREVWARAVGTRGGSPFASTARLLAWREESGEWVVLIVAALSHPSDVWIPLLLDAHAPAEPWRGPGAIPPGFEPAARTIAEARALADTTTTRASRSIAIAEDTAPPPFERVRYPTALGEMRAYLAPARSAEATPAVLWLHAGTDLESLEPAPRLLAEAGLVVMSPALRGETGNPGNRETLLGELDDAREALDHLRGQPGVDPARVVVMGHGGGATLAMLLAESGAPARAFVCFGGTEDVLPYLIVGPDGDGPIVEPRSTDESWVRSPIHFLSEIAVPTYFIEGGTSPNAPAGARLRAAAPASSPLRVIVPEGGDHDSLVEPTLRLILPRLRETGPLVITPEEIEDLTR